MKKIILILVLVCICGLFTGCCGILDSIAGAINENKLFNTLEETGWQE